MIAVKTNLAWWMFFCMVLWLSVIGSSQEDPNIASPPVSAGAQDATILNDAQLRTLVAPIALYPDTLIAQILPASTYPLEVVVASRWLVANPNPTEAAIDAQDLEPSLKALLHYPTVLAMMNDQLEWTQELGLAFLNQQADVMSTIQELRQQARIAGALQSTPQQQVVTDGDDVQIIPVNPEVIYVPVYDPQLIYGDNYGVGISFGVGYSEGLWLGNGVDWHHRWVTGGNGWHHGWDKPAGDPRDRKDPPMTKPWERNGAQPLPLRSRAAVQETARTPGPGYNTDRARAVTPGVFGGYQNRNNVQQQTQRAQQSRPAPQQARPMQQARPAPRPASPQVFHVQGTGRSAAAQSARGNASRAASGGGGGGRRK